MGFRSKELCLNRVARLAGCKRVRAQEKTNGCIAAIGFFFTTIQPSDKLVLLTSCGSADGSARCCDYGETMKVISIGMALVLGLASATAFACPKGTHLVGGTGPHHKGGKCEAAADTKPAEAKPEAKAESKADTKAESKSAKKREKSADKKKAEAAK